MTDFARLQEKLSKLKSQELSSRKGRVLRGDRVLSLILTEMGETILPRRLTFTAGDRSASFAVANRRCQALLSPVRGSSMSEIADEAITDVESGPVAEIKDYLIDLFSEAGELNVTSSRLTAGFPSDVGVPIPQLARVWEVSAGSDEDRPIDEVMADFLGALPGVAIAWLNIVGEEVVSDGGEEAARAAIGEHAAMFLDGYFARFDQVYGEEAGAVLTAIAGPSEGSAVIFVELGEQTAFVVAPAKNVPQIASVWERLTS